MGFWKKLFSRELTFEEEDAEEEVAEDLVSIREDVDFTKEQQRTRYILNCLEQMAEASRETELLTGEYQLITAYLTDMEEIENFPKDTFKELSDTAAYLRGSEEERKKYLSKKERLTDTRFLQVEGQEEEIAEGLRKIKDAENYAKLVKQDLKRLDSERHAYEYRRNELKMTLENLKGITTISLISAGICVVMLFILQFVAEMNVKIGYLLMAGIIAIVFTVIFVKHGDAVRELQSVELSINQLILLQNRVKIRYVNNRNLLDYYYLKYKVDNGKQLEKIWSMYQNEKEERKRFEQAQTDLEFFKKKLLSILRNSRVKYPDRWLHQVSAILDPKEMVERRHELIVERQALRKQLDYNKELASKAKEEIMDVVNQYPQYAKEIGDMVDHYEKVSS